MSSYNHDQLLFWTALALIGALYALYSGYILYRHPENHAPFQNRIRSIQTGEPISSYRDSNRLHGLLRLVGGGLLLVGGILQLMGLALAR